MSLINTLTPNNNLLMAATTSRTAAPVATPAQTVPIGSSIDKPFMLTDSTKWVSFTPNSVPQFLSYNNNTYQFASANNGTSLYKPTDGNTHRKVELSFTGNSKDVQTGTKTERTQVGTKQEQIGTEKVQTGTKQVQTGTEKVKTGTKTTYKDSTETVNIHLGREIDGQNATGAIGDMLTRGTTQLNDAAEFFKGTSFAKYQVSSLTGENNQINSGTIDSLKQNLGADNMYLAGDPHVGGKGNNYAQVDVLPNSGFMTVYEDGSDTGRKTTINSHPDTINAQGNKAFTEYGFVVQDDNGAKTKAELSGGKLNITAADGTQKTLLPGETYIVGNAADPAAKFYYASMPGGENGTNEQRLVFESYEKPTAAVVSKLVESGMSQSEASAIRQTTQASFGFRIPDGKGSFRSSGGVTGAALPKTTNNVKTYYDAHFSKPDQRDLSLTKNVKTPVIENCFEDRPVYKDVPVYTDKPVYKDVPVYQDKEVPIYGKEYEICKQYYSPLVLDLDGKGIQTTAPNKTFDIDGDGLNEKISWFGANNGVLAFDANKNGKIDSNGKELLGDSSDINGDGQPDGYANGFEALKALATSRLGAGSVSDNILDAAEIKALEAKAGLRILVNNQSQSLSSLGISKLNLGYTEKTPGEADAFGNETRQFGSFERTVNGQSVSRSMNDIWLTKNPLDGSQATTPAPVVTSVTPAPTPVATTPVVTPTKPVTTTPAPVASTPVAAPSNSRSTMLAWLKAYMDKLGATA